MSVVNIDRAFSLYSETKFMRPSVQPAAMVQSRFFQRSNGMHKVVIGALVLAALAGCAGSKMKESFSVTPYRTLASDKATLVVA